MPDKTVLRFYRDEINAYLVNKLLPFWFDRSKDQEAGGFITHFDKHGNDSGEDEKSLIAQTRMLYSLYECTKTELHRRNLIEIIEIITRRLLHPRYATGIPQFKANWEPAPQIKFDIIWGWDRFKPDGLKSSADDNTSYGHNVELAWLMMHALDILGIPLDIYIEKIKAMLDHAIENGPVPLTIRGLPCSA